MQIITNVYRMKFHHSFWQMYKLGFQLNYTQKNNWINTFVKHSEYIFL